MDNKLFVAEILDHTHIGLYHELIVSAQHVKMTRGFFMHTEKQIAEFAIKQAQATIETLGYVRITEERFKSVSIVRDTINQAEEEFSYKAAESLLSIMEEKGLKLTFNNIWHAHKNLNVLN